jgi:hypothetical protein
MGTNMKTPNSNKQDSLEEIIVELQFKTEHAFHDQNLIDEAGEQAKTALRHYLLKETLDLIGDDFVLPELSHAHTTDGKLISGEEVAIRVKIANDTKADLRVAAKERWS